MKLAIALLLLVAIATCDDTAITADPTATATATPTDATITADPTATATPTDATTTADPAATATPTDTTTTPDPSATGTPTDATTSADPTATATPTDATTSVDPTATATPTDTTTTADPTATAAPTDTTTTPDPTATATATDPSATTTATDPTNTTTAPDTTNTTAHLNPVTATGSYTYDLIPMSDYDQYALIPTLRDMGIQLVLAAALKNGHITDASLVLQTTNSIEHRIGSQNNEFYRFNCSLANGNDKTQTVVAYFVARHNTATNEDAIPYWYYLANMFWVPNPTTSVVGTNQTVPEPEPQPEPEPEPEPVEEVVEEVEEAPVVEEPAPEPPAPVTDTTNTTLLYPWVLLPAEQYTSAFNIDNANYGMNYFVSQEVPKGNITNGTYSVKLIDQVWQQIMPDVTNYRYIIQAVAAEAPYIYNVTFGLFYPTSNSARNLGFYRFQTLDANGNPVASTGTLPTLNPMQDASETITTTTVDGKPVSTTSGGITAAP